MLTSGHWQGIPGCEVLKIHDTLQSLSTIMRSDGAYNVQIGARM